jgi:hypothetical protein
VRQLFHIIFGVLLPVCHIESLVLGTVEFAIIQDGTWTQTEYQNKHYNTDQKDKET